MRNGNYETSKAPEKSTSYVAQNPTSVSQQL